jgi:hypothetical protein
MIPMTYEPTEGVVVDVQDHARWTGTILDRYIWGDDQFGPRAHQMDVETPSGGKDRTYMDQGLSIGEEEDVPLGAP